MTHPVHVDVEARERESSENLVRRFVRKCKKMKIHELLLHKSPFSATYTKPSDIRRMKKAKSKYRAKKEQEDRDKN